jgi:hypothetical protein
MRGNGKTGNPMDMEGWYMTMDRCIRVVLEME